MGMSLKRTSTERSADWADKQADAIVNAFLADDQPEDLLRLERAIAVALRAAYEGRTEMHHKERRRSLGVGGKQKRSAQKE